MLINLNAPIVNNKIISSKHLGYKDLHLIAESASYPTDSLDYKYSEAKITNPKTKIYILALNNHLPIILAFP